MYQKFAFLLISFFISYFAISQNTKTIPPTIANRSVYNFKTINPNLKFVFIEDKATNGHPEEGDDVMMHMIAICNNRFMYNSFTVNKGKPGAFSISKAAFKGDIADALMLMTPGDSIICLVDAKAMYDYSKKPMPDFIKPGDKIQYNIRLISIKPKAQIQKEREAEFAKFMQQQEVASQPVNDDTVLQTYFRIRNIAPLKTASGMYYQINKQGTGPLAAPGDEVVMNYRGTLLDGTIFDSNIDSVFNHVQPLTFILGTGRVIKGWDEGITYLNPGSKAFFYLPANLAYGAQSRPASAANPKGIPPNSVLIFEVELVAAKHRQ